MPIKLLERREYAKKFSKDLSMGLTDSNGVAIRKGFTPIEIKAVSDDVIRFIISDGSVDRDNDTVNVNGWQLDNYLKNPVFLWAHEHHSVPIGKGTDLHVQDEKLISDTIFVGKDIMEFAHMIYQLYKGGFMNAVSVGFMPDERVWSEEQGGIKFLTQELLEYSAVPVPANPNALQIARSAGIDIAPLKGWAESLLDEWTEGNRSIGASRKSLERMFKDADNGKMINGPGQKLVHPTTGKELELDPAKVKEIRQKNIWEPRLKLARETNIYNLEEWGIASLDEIPAAILAEHQAIIHAAEAETKAKDIAKFIEYMKEVEVGEHSVEIKNFAKSVTGEDNIEELYTVLGEKGFRALVELVKEISTRVEAPKDISEIETLKAELLELHKDSDDLDKIKNMLDGIQDSETPAVAIAGLKLSLAEAEKSASTTSTDLANMTKERDDLLVHLAEVIVQNDSKQGVDPAKMIGMFGKGLSKAVAALTGRLPD